MNHDVEDVVDQCCIKNINFAKINFTNKLTPQASSLLLLLLLCGGSSLLVIVILCRLLETQASALLLLSLCRLEPPHSLIPYGGLSLLIIIILLEARPSKRIIIIMKSLEPLCLHFHFWRLPRDYSM
jgi:hypothetical protein